MRVTFRYFSVCISILYFDKLKRYIIITLIHKLYLIPFLVQYFHIILNYLSITIQSIFKTLFYIIY
jgi:hypothetical protein